jgi:hypothetical protein
MAAAIQSHFIGHASTLVRPIGASAGAVASNVRVEWRLQIKRKYRFLLHHVISNSNTLDVGTRIAQLKTRMCV